MKAGVGGGSGSSGWVENDGYLPLGEVQGERIAQLARDADTVVVMSSPSVDYVLAKEASRAGRCYIITSERKEMRDGGRREAGPHQTLEIGENDHLENTLVRFADGFGANVVLIDPRSSSPRGLFLSSSLDPEAIRCGRRLDVYLEPSEVSEMWQIIRWAFWAHASGELRDGNVAECTPLGTLNLPKPARILRLDTRDRGIEAAAESILGDGVSHVIVAAPVLDAGHWMEGRLCELAGAGVSVTVLTSTDYPAGAASTLRGAGIRVLGFSCLHANAVASERGALLAPPVAAWRGPGLEFGLLLKDGRADDVRRVMREWEVNCQYEFR